MQIYSEKRQAVNERLLNCSFTNVVGNEVTQVIKRLVSIISIISILSGLTVFPAAAQDSERKVFSGNNWNDGDEYIYTSILGEASLVNASNTPVYSYDASEDTQAVAIDKNNTYLTGGHLFRYDGDYVVGSQWNLKKPVVTVWNLNTEAVLDGVDVWSTVSDGITDSVIVYVSNDGANWEQVNDGTVIGTSYNSFGSAQIYRYPVEFAPVTAQYVKVEVYPPQDTGTYHKCYVNEIVIFGYETKFTLLKSVVNKYSDTFEQIESISVSGADELKKALSDGKALLNSGSADEAAILSAAEAIKTAYGNIVYSKTPGLLTGNVIRYNNEKKVVTHDFYPGLTEYKTMSIKSATKADASGTDITKNAAVLINGKAIRWDAGALWGDWGEPATNIKPFTITLESEKEVYFTGVDLYAWANAEPKCIRTLRVEVSDDNVNYKTVETISSKFNGDTSGMIYTDGGYYGQILSTTDMVPVKGKYIRLTATHGGKQAVIDEIAIKGFPVIEGLSVGFDSVSYLMTDADDNITEVISGAVKVDVSGNLVNNGTGAVTGKVYSAAYSGGRLIAVSVSSEVTVGNGDNNTAGFSNTIEYGAGMPNDTKIVNYYWDNSMKPLANISDVN